LCVPRPRNPRNQLQRKGLHAPIASSYSACTAVYRTQHQRIE
jgi:hypothetical protein